MTPPGPLIEAVIERTRHLAAIPAPPLEERSRSAVVQQWWADQRLGRRPPGSIELSPIAVGFRVLARTILNYTRNHR